MKEEIHHISMSIQADIFCFTYTWVFFNYSCMFLLCDHCIIQLFTVMIKFPKLPWVRRPTEHLAAVFDDVLVAVWVLDSVFPRPGSFNLRKSKYTPIRGGRVRTHPVSKPHLNSFQIPVKISGKCLQSYCSTP